MTTFSYSIVNVIDFQDPSVNTYWYWHEETYIYIHTYSHRYYFFFKKFKTFALLYNCIIIRLNFISANNSIFFLPPIEPCRFEPPEKKRPPNGVSHKTQRPSSDTNGNLIFTTHDLKGGKCHPPLPGKKTGIDPLRINGVGIGKFRFGFRPIFRGPWTCGCFEECFTRGKPCQVGSSKLTTPKTWRTGVIKDCKTPEKNSQCVWGTILPTQASPTFDG